MGVDPEHVVAALAVLVGGIVQSGVGFGFSLVVAPALAAIHDPRLAVPTAAVLALVVNGLTLSAERRPSQVRRRTAVLLVAGSLPGMVAGAVVLTRAPDDALRVLIGAVVLAAVVARVLQDRRRAADAGAGPAGAAEGGSRADLAVGALSGALATSTGVNGPPLVLRMLHLRVAPHELRDTLAAVYLAAGVLTLGVLAVGGALDLVPAAGLLVVAAAAGQGLGRGVFARIAGRHEQAVLVVLTVTALAALAPLGRAVG